MNHPLISIITITFNAAEVVRPTMKSVKEQSFTDFEHLIIDGASSDDTLSVVRQAGRKEVRILSEPDHGIYDAMNKGLKMAKGKYVLFLNAGDAFHAPDSLMLFAQAAYKNPDIIYGDTIIVDADRQFVAPRHLSAPEILSFKSFEKGMLVCHQAFMVRKAIAPAYDTSYRFSADFDWCIRSLKHTDPGKCINLKKVVIDYLADGTTDKNKIASLKERFRIMRRHYGLFTTLTNHISFITRALKRKKL